MADDGARDEARRRLDRLVSYQGRSRVREVLGIDDATLAGLLTGSLAWPPGARERFDHAWGVLEQLGAPAGVSPAEVSCKEDEAGAAGSAVPDSEMSGGVDEPEQADDPVPVSRGGEEPAARVVVDPKPTAPAGGGRVHRRRAEAPGAVAERRRQLQLLWWARFLVVTHYMWPTEGISRHRRLAAWAVLLRLEIELIQSWESPLPRLRRNRERWDEGRRRREITFRVQRLGDVRRERGRMHLRRLADWLLKRDEDPEEALRKRVLDEAGRRGPPLPIGLFAAEPDWVELDRLAPRGPRGADG